MLADSLRTSVDKAACLLTVEALVEAEQHGGVEEGMHLCGLAAVRKEKSKRKRRPGTLEMAAGSVKYQELQLEKLRRWSIWGKSSWL